LTCIYLKIIFFFFKDSCDPDDQNYGIAFPEEVSQTALEKTIERIEIIPLRLEKKQGPAEARNKGVKFSKGEILLFLDSDTKITSNYLFNLFLGFKDSHIGASGGKIIPLKKTLISNYLGVSLFEGYPRMKRNSFVRNYPSCSLAVKKSILEEVGGFKENIGDQKNDLHLMEDKELCEKIRKKRYKIFYNSNATIYHKNRYELRDLIKVLVRGAKTRKTFIKEGKKDPFSLLLKFNIPLIYLIMIISLFFINLSLSFLLILIGFIGIFTISMKSFIETGMFFQSFFVKPWMDVLSLIVINIGVLYYRIKK
jgi:GT2 family glycosyltransferase